MQKRLIFLTLHSTPAGIENTAVENTSDVSGNHILNYIKRQIYNKSEGVEDTVFIVVNTCHSDDSQLSLVGQLIPVF